MESGKPKIVRVVEPALDEKEPPNEPEYERVEEHEVDKTKGAFD